MFLNTDFLRSDTLVLRLDHTVDADPARDWLPAYHFLICAPDGTQMGKCDLRIGHNHKTYYGGNIGYRIDEPYRGHHYAAKACRLLFELAKRHGMDRLTITCTPDNLPSRRTCEALSGRLLEITDLPADNDMRPKVTRVCVFEFTLCESSQAHPQS